MCIRDRDGKMPVCTVIGFPNGYNTTSVKVFETKEALKDGAEEIDMVINIGWVRMGQYDKVLAEINALKAVSYTHLCRSRSADWTRAYGA